MISAHPSPAPARCVLRSLLPALAAAATEALPVPLRLQQQPLQLQAAPETALHAGGARDPSEDDEGGDDDEEEGEGEGGGGGSDAAWAAAGSGDSLVPASQRRSRVSSAGSSGTPIAGTPRDATVACLDYYVKSGDPAPRGAVTLTAAALCGASLVQRGSAAAAKVEARPRVLELMSGGRPFFAQAETDEDARAWLAAFHALGAQAGAQLGLT